MLKGFDFSFGSGLTADEAKRLGYQFVCRYLSGGNSKDITKAELGNWHAAGVPVVFVWETTGVDMTSVAAGRADAQGAQAELDRLGASDAVVFFAADEAQEPDLHGYFDGVLEVIPKSRAGIYGGIGSVASAFNAGQVSFGWQTAAWSNSHWDDRALLRQVQNDIHVGPAQADLDEAAYWNKSTVLGLSDDFGQWPRPGKNPPPPPHTSGPQRHVAPAGNAQSLNAVANSRNTTEAHLDTVSLANLSPDHQAIYKAYRTLEDLCAATKGYNRPAMPTGFIYYTEG